MSSLEKLVLAIPGQWERVIATAILLVAGFAAAQLWARYLARGDVSAEKRRLHLVWARNAIWFLVLFTIVSVWASTIAGFALSLAAVAGAILIVSKELLMCILGYLYLTLVRPFEIGDIVEIGDVNGRVIDIDMFATELAELGHAGQRTGNTVAFPNGLMLTQPLRNISSTGEYVLHLFRVPIPQSAANDLERVEQAAMVAADKAANSWAAEAEAHFRKISDERFIELPSGRSKVLWDFSDPTQLALVVRVACPADQRLKVEQAVFRETWRTLQGEHSG